MRWASPRPRLRCDQRRRVHFSSSSIAQRAVCHSCKVLQSTMKRTKESDMDGQAKLFSFGFSRGRSGNQPEPNPSSSGSSEQIRKPSSSKESTSSQLEEEQRSRSQSVWLRPVLFPGSTSYLQGEVRARESQIPASSHIWRTETELSTGASPSGSAFWTAASDSSRQNGWTSTNGLRTPHRRTEVSTMRSVSQKSWSRCWAVEHEAHDQLDKSFNNPEGARCQQNAQREC